MTYAKARPTAIVLEIGPHSLSIDSSSRIELDIDSDGHFFSYN